MKYWLRFYLGITLISCAFDTQVYGVGSGALQNITAVSARQMGTGYTFAAIADDPSSIYFNPAGLTQVKGFQTIFGGTYLTMESEHSSSKTTLGDPTGSKNDEMNDNIPVAPFFYASYSRKDSAWAFGLGVNSPFGLVTEWDNNSFSKYYATKSKLLMYIVNPTAAYAINEKMSFGVGVDFFNLYETELNSNVPALAAEPDGQSKLSGDGTAWGYNFGAHYKLNEKHSFGLGYRSQANIIVKGDLVLTGLSSTYGMGAGASFNTNVQTEFKMPQSVLLGYGYRPTTKLTISIDYDWVDWSCVKDTSFNYDLNPGFLTPRIERNWKASNNIGAGAEWHAKNWLDLRGGLFAYERVIPSSTLEASLPDSSRWGLTFGSGIKIKNTTIDIGYNAIFFNKRKINNHQEYLVAPNTYTYSQDGNFNTTIHAISLSLTQKWGTN